MFDLVPDDCRRLGGAGIEALAREQVGEVDPRGLHADAHGAGFDHGLGRVPHLEHVRRAVARDDDLPHGVEA